MAPARRARFGWWPGAAAAAGVAAACAPALRVLPSPPPPGAAERAPAPALASVVHALVGRVEQEPAGPRRAELASEAVAAGQRCAAAWPEAPPCDYALAIALGLQARERPATAHDGLARMVAMLRRAASADPALDRAGPDRVLALVLLRAPGWPAGPGDAEEGLAAARRAVARFPEHPPNLLALAEALRAGGEEVAATQAARRALELAEEAERAGEPGAAAWRAEAVRAVGSGPRPARPPRGPPPPGGSGAGR